MFTILYEDNHLIAVRKPHGLLTQGDATNDPSLINEVRYFLKKRDNKPGNVFVGLVHRLDRPVGGVVVFAKTSKGAARLSEQIRNRTVEKVYWAVVEGVPKKESGTIIEWLVKDEKANRVTAHDHEVPGGLRAELAYRVLATPSYQEGDGGSFSHVEIRPKTGRPHQIRVAMASLDTPIVGDVKYGASRALKLANGGSALALFARSFAFDQPVTKERVTVTAEPEPGVFDIRACFDIRA